MILELLVGAQMFFVSLLKPGPSSFMLLYERIWAYTPISESSSGSRGHNHCLGNSYITTNMFAKPQHQQEQLVPV